MPASWNVDFDVVWWGWPHARIWQRLKTDRGDVTEFAVQLEYNVVDRDERFDRTTDADWKPVARVDHSYHDHDWREEPPHIDIYRDWQKWKQYDDFGMVSPKNGIDFGLRYLYKNKEFLLARFERWHGLTGPYAASPTHR